MQDQVDALITYQFSIEGGMHDGASVSFSSGSVTVGSDPDCDVVLDDPGIADRHLELDILPQGLLLTPLVSGVGVAGSTLPDDTDAPVAVACPAVINLAGVTIRIVSDRPEAPPPPEAVEVPPDTVARWPQVVTAGATLLIGFTVTLAQMPSWFSTSQTANAASVPASPKPDATPRATDGGSAIQQAVTKLPASPETHVPQQHVPARPTAAAAAAAIKAALTKEGLMSIVIQVDGDVLAASGTVDPGSLATWLQMQRSFDGEYGGALQLVNRVIVKPETMLNFAIDAVWGGNNPNIMIKGQKYFEGAALPDGWTLKRIEPHDIVLMRGKREVLLPY